MKKYANILHIMTTLFNSQIDSNLLGRRIMTARRERGLTLKCLGESVGVHYTQISRIERGGATRLSKNVQKICKFLNVAIDVDRSTKAAESLLHKVEQLIGEWPESEQLIRSILDVMEGALRSRNA
jgi:transcriptional regulator with XRE-family HTH domain